MSPGRRWRAGSKAAAARPPTHPGEMLQEEYLRPRNMDPRALAPRIGILTSELLDLIDGRARVTSALAEQLGREFGTSADVWLTRQAEWDAWVQHADRSPR